MKITTPTDDNYSDDELTFLPYLTFWLGSNDAVKLTPVLASLERTWYAAIRNEKSDLWTAIYLAIVGGDRVTELDAMVRAGRYVWLLRACYVNACG